MFKKLSAILLVFALIASFAACKKLEGNEFIVEENAFVTDENGNTQELETRVDENGKTEYFYTDNSGNIIVVDKNKVEVETSYVPVQTTLSDKEIDKILENQDFDKLQDVLVEDITEPEFEMSDGVIPEDSFEEVEVEVDNEGKPVHGTATKTYAEIISSGTFTVDLTVQTITEGTTSVMPIKMMKDGNKMLVETSVPVSTSGKMRVNMLINDDGFFMVIPIMNAYYQVPTEDAGDLSDAMGSFDISDIEGDLAMTDSYVSSANVDLNGKTYNCDIYESEDGVTTKYYYLNNELKRIESESGSDIYIVEFKEVSGKVTKSKFKTPTGRNLADFAAALEGMTFNY